MGDINLSPTTHQLFSSPRNNIFDANFQTYPETSEDRYNTSNFVDSNSGLLKYLKHSAISLEPFTAIKEFQP